MALESRISRQENTFNLRKFAIHCGRSSDRENIVRQAGKVKAARRPREITSVGKG